MTDRNSSMQSNPDARHDDSLLLERDPATGERTSQDGDACREPENLARLDLLLPDDLPAEITLDRACGNRMHALLTKLLDALELDHAARLTKIEELLNDAVLQDVSPVEITTDGLPLTPFQATDYDRYFRVNRLQTPHLALAMVRSLLQTIHAVTRLFCRCRDLSGSHVQQQIDGFVTHTHLLTRTFGLKNLR